MSKPTWFPSVVPAHDQATYLEVPANLQAFVERNEVGADRGQLRLV